MLISWPLIYVTLAALCLSTFGRTRLSPAEAWLSRQTYFVYLYHLFFVFSLQRLWPQPAGGVSAPALFAYAVAGLLGPCLLAVALARFAPPRLARFVGVGVSETREASP